MNQINSAKLLNSKWTAVKPVNREKHFLVSKVEYDEGGSVLVCILESVLTKNEYAIDWRDLKSKQQWIQGWV